MMKKLLFLLLILFVPQLVQSEDFYHAPMDPPLTITGTFGEFRGTHFHAGIDFSTQRKTGRKVYAIDSGYVSRIKVAPDGYGNALYLKLRDGNVAVYAHLSKFNPKVAARVYSEQKLRSDSFVDFELNAEELPFRKGDLVAWSGDTGGVPPHLHFELRDQEENLLNPLLYGFQLEDKTAPAIVGLAFVPLNKNNIPHSVENWKFVKPSKGSKQKQYVVRPQKISSGSVGVEVAIIDDSSGNKCAPVRVTLLEDEEVLFDRYFERLTWEDYKQNFLVYNRNLWIKNKGIYERLYNLPQGDLSFQKGKNSGTGILEIEPNETQEYSILIEDAAQNRSVLSFTLIGGEPLKEEESKEISGFVARPGKTQKISFLEPELQLKFDPKSVYYSSSIQAKRIENPELPHQKNISEIIELEPENILLNKAVKLVYFSSEEKLQSQNLYFFNQRNQNWRFIKNQEKSDKKIEAFIRSFGVYSLIEDRMAPLVRPIRLIKDSNNKAQWLKFSVEDNLSGVNYRQIKVLNNGKPLIFSVNVNKKEISVPIERIGSNPKIKIIVPDYSTNKREIVIDLTKLPVKKKPSKS